MPDEFDPTLGIVEFGDGSCNTVADELFFDHDAADFEGENWWYIGSRFVKGGADAV